MKEKLILVNDKDEVWGEIDRDSQLESDRTRAVALIVENKKGEILTAKRAKNMHRFPSLWGSSCAGGVSAGETYHEAMKREIQEELGVTLDPKPWKKLSMDDGRKTITQWFHVVVDFGLKKFKRQKEEVDELQFVSKKKLIAWMKKEPEAFTPGWKEIILNHLIP